MLGHSGLSFVFDLSLYLGPYLGHCVPPTGTPSNDPAHEVYLVRIHVVEVSVVLVERLRDNIFEISHR